MKALIFDMDGLMVDTERLYFECCKEIAKMYGREMKNETYWRIMGRKPLEAMTIYVEELKLDISPQEALDIRSRLFDSRAKEGLLPMPGLFEILNAFKGEMKLAIATGSTRDLLDLTLDQLDIRKFFDVLQPSDEIGNGKPDPEIYLSAVKKLGLSPNECVVLEDSSNGALAGKRAGCYTIAVPSGYTSEQDFSFVDFKAESLVEAIEHIRTLA